MTTHPRSGIRFGLLALGLVLAGLAGYGGYLLYPRFGLPPAAGASLLVLAATAGFAAFFSPCSFPLLATLLARGTGDSHGAGRRLARAAVFATSLSVGAMVFVLAVGVVFALGGRGLAASVTFTSVPGRLLRGTVGVLLVAAGLVQSGRIQLDLRSFEPAVHGLLQRQAGLRRRHPTAGAAVFGFGYLAAGFG